MAVAIVSRMRRGSWGCKTPLAIGAANGIKLYDQSGNPDYPKPKATEPTRKVLHSPII